MTGSACPQPTLHARRAAALLPATGVLGRLNSYYTCESYVVSAPRRVRTSPTDDWDTLQLKLAWPEQHQYELIRPVVLFGLPPAERAQQTGASTRTIARHADRFEE